MLCLVKTVTRTRIRSFEVIISLLASGVKSKDRDEMRIRMALMKRLLCLCWLCVGLTSCSFLHSETKRVLDPKTGVISESTSARAFTLFDANASLTKFRNQSSPSATNQWAAGTFISGLNESSTSSNLTSIVAAVAAGVVQGLK